MAFEYFPRSFFFQNNSQESKLKAFVESNSKADTNECTCSRIGICIRIIFRRYTCSNGKLNNAMNTFTKSRRVIKRHGYIIMWVENGNKLSWIEPHDFFHELITIHVQKQQVEQLERKSQQRERRLERESQPERERHQREHEFEWESQPERESHKREYKLLREKPAWAGRTDLVKSNMH